MGVVSAATGSAVFPRVGSGNFCATADAALPMAQAMRTKTKGIARVGMAGLVSSAPKHYHNHAGSSPSLHAPPPPPDTLAQVSRSPTVRLNTSRSGVESLSG